MKRCVCLLSASKQKYLKTEFYLIIKRVKSGLRKKFDKQSGVFTGNNNNNRIEQNELTSL